MGRADDSKIIFKDIEQNFVIDLIALEVLFPDYP